MFKNTVRFLGFMALASAMNLAVVTGQVSHTILGSLKVDATKTQEKVPSLFFVVLSANFHVIGRQPIASGGQFRFNNVANGEYELVLELEGQEITKKRILLQSPQRTDFRHDLEIEWRDTFANRSNAGTVSAIYPRPPVRQARFEQASATKEADKAIEIFRQLLKDDPRDFVAWTELGTLYFKQDKADEATRAYEKALEEKPDFLLALLNLGKLKITRQDYANALPLLERVLAIEPNSAQANYFMGEAYLGVKKGSKAVSYFYQALKLDPTGMAEAHLRLAALYHAAGYRERAAAEFEQFVNKRPDYPEKDKLLQYIKENKKP